MCYYNYRKTKEAQKMRDIIKAIIIIVLTIAFLLAIGVCSYIGSKEIYNHGICEKCGGHYEFADCGGGQIKIFIYKCDTCGHMIKTTALLNSED